MANYSPLSPYYTTGQPFGYLDIANFRSIPAASDDILFTVVKPYENRPDLLAYDLYQTVQLWWVFALRNPSVIQDPVFDMKSGVKIFLPKLSSLKITLGL
jgi:hypothetical protein